MGDATEFYFGGDYDDVSDLEDDEKEVADFLSTLDTDEARKALFVELLEQNDDVQGPIDSVRQFFTGEGTSGQKAASAVMSTLSEAEKTVMKDQRAAVRERLKNLTEAQRNYLINEHLDNMGLDEGDGDFGGKDAAEVASDYSKRVGALGAAVKYQATMEPMVQIMTRMKTKGADLEDVKSSKDLMDRVAKMNAAELKLYELSPAMQAAAQKGDSEAFMGAVAAATGKDGLVLGQPVPGGGREINDQRELMARTAETARLFESSLAINSGAIVDNTTAINTLTEIIARDPTISMTRAMVESRPPG